MGASMVMAPSPAGMTSLRIGMRVAICAV
jgi:hypothetical protein